MKLPQTWLDISYLPLLLSATITIFTVRIIFVQTQDILAARLKDRQIAIVSTAALQFRGEEFEEIIDESDIINPLLKDIIARMQKIRDANKDIRYIYIWRRTEQPNILEFIADAEMLDPIDSDTNGIIEGEEIPPMPGEDYDASDTPEVQSAFSHPVTTAEFITDKWGTFASAWAPIKDSKGNQIAILGIDVEITDFYKLVSATLIPFVLLAILLLLILSIQTIYLVRLWKSRVGIVKELDRQKDELLSIVSHQLATPVSSIKWYTEMLIDGDLGKVTAQQKEHLASMMNISSNLADLVSMILDVSRIQLGRMQIEKQKLDLNKFLKEILEIIKPKAIEKRVNFKVEIPNNLPMAMLDKRYTRMTLENLLSNAIKYTLPNGTIYFDVAIKDNELHCKVQDTGLGIPKKDQNKIFGRMYRASNVRNEIDGNGFGLYIAKGAIEAQGGKIWFESMENKGTTFYIQVPLQ